MAAKVKIIRHIDNHLRWIFDFFGHRDSIGFQFMLVSALDRLLPGVFGIWQAMSKCGQGGKIPKEIPARVGKNLQDNLFLFDGR